MLLDAFHDCLEAFHFLFKGVSRVPMYALVMMIMMIVITIRMKMMIEL